MQPIAYEMGPSIAKAQIQTSLGVVMIRLVVFDAYGTLFDVYSVSALAVQGLIHKTT